MDIKISVLLCVFNGHKSISRAIKSILKQDFKEFEFLIINDGSTDNTKDIIYKFLEIDSRIKYFFKEHTGLTNSLQYGLQKASGEWIARIDADDYSEFNRLSKQIKFVENNRNVVLLGSNFSLVKGKRIIHKSNLLSNHSFLVNNLKRSRGFFPHSSAFFSRKKAIQVGGYRKSFYKAQDHDLWLRLSETGEIACCKEDLVLVYDHQDRITNRLSGYPQYIYALAAIVSYFARKEKVYRLESKINRDEIESFLEILSKFVKDTKYSEIESFKEDFKYLIAKRKNFYLFFEITLLFIQYRYLLILIFKIIFLRKNFAYEFFRKYKHIF